MTPSTDLSIEDLREKVARLLYEIEPWRDPGENIDGFQVVGGGPVSWEKAKRLHAEFSDSAEDVGPWSVVADNYSTADAILALLPAPPKTAAPEGWRLVPEEPTEEMRAQGQWAQFDTVNPPVNLCVKANETAVKIYRAMLAASPPPPTGKDRA